MTWEKSHVGARFPLLTFFVFSFSLSLFFGCNYFATQATRCFLTMIYYLHCFFFVLIIRNAISSRTCSRIMHFRSRFCVIFLTAGATPDQTNRGHSAARYIGDIAVHESCPASERPIQVWNALILAARSLITKAGARGIFGRCLLFYIICRASWSNLFELLNWFSRHFLRASTEVSDRAELWRELTTTEQPCAGRDRNNKGPVSVSFHTLFYFNTIKHERYEMPLRSNIVIFVKQI